MKTILMTICLMAATMLNAQKHEYEVEDQITVGDITYTYIKAVSGNTGKESYNLVLSYPNRQYSVEICEISLTTIQMREQFTHELQMCIDSVADNFKGVSKTIAENQTYMLVVHDFRNLIFIADHKGRFTYMTVKEAEFVIQWINRLE